MGEFWTLADVLAHSLVHVLNLIYILVFRMGLAHSAPFLLMLGPCWPSLLHSLWSISSRYTACSSVCGLIVFRVSPDV